MGRGSWITPIYSFSDEFTDSLRDKDSDSQLKKVSILCDDSKHRNWRKTVGGNLEFWWLNYIQKVIDSAYVRVYCAEVRNDIFLPYRLVNTETIKQATRKMTGILMLDSYIRDPNVSNRTIIKKAIEYNADIVIPKDYSNKRYKTIASVKEFFQVINDFKVHEEKEFEVLIPIQGNDLEEYVDCYSRLEKYGEYFAIGGVVSLGKMGERKGMKKENYREQINIVRNVLDNTDIRKCHLFGLTQMRFLPLYKDKRVFSCDSANFFHQTLKDLPQLKFNAAAYSIYFYKAYIDFCYAISPYGEKISRSNENLENFISF